MTSKERILWITFRRALKMMVAAIDKYLDNVYSIESEVKVNESDNISGVIDHN